MSRRIYDYHPDGIGMDAPSNGLGILPPVNEMKPPVFGMDFIQAISAELTDRDKHLDEEDMARAEEDIGWLNYARRCKRAVETLRPFLTDHVYTLLYEHVEASTARRRPAITSNLEADV